MPSITARRQCPDLIFVKPRFEVYKAVSQQIRETFAEHTSMNSLRWTRPTYLPSRVFFANRYPLRSKTLYIAHSAGAATGISGCELYLSLALVFANAACKPCDLRAEELFVPSILAGERVDEQFLLAVYVEQSSRGDPSL
jgi:hypothetical protein